MYGIDDAIIDFNKAEESGYTKSFALNRIQIAKVKALTASSCIE